MVMFDMVIVEFFRRLNRLFKSSSKFSLDFNWGSQIFSEDSQEPRICKMLPFFLLNKINHLSVKKIFVFISEMLPMLIFVNYVRRNVNIFITLSLFY